MSMHCHLFNIFEERCFSLKTIQNMYDHLNWANQRILKTLQSLEVENQKVSRLFSHILFAEKIWITRLQGLDSTGLPIWSDIDIRSLFRTC